MEFDLIVVGAGSAGCALANRLSADGRHTVALIEAGPRDTNPWIHIPVGYFRTMGNPATDWCHRIEADRGLDGRSMAWPRGRVLGGSSSINGLLYVRGQPEDFDHWRQLGNVGWSWADVLPYFRRAETWEGADADDSGLRGSEGPLQVTRSRLHRQVVDLWVEAGVNAGYRHNPDYNATTQEGVGYFQLTASGGRRCSAATAYLKPARKRPNLKIMPDTRAARLTFDGSRVTGVLAWQGDKRLQIRARAEVVLSTGAIGSPQLLMLSGIGDAAELRSHGIEVRQHLPGVGRNLQDHLQARPVFCTALPTINVEVSRFWRKALIAAQYALTRSGPMTMAASLGTGFLKTEPHLATPDIQFHIQPFSASEPGQGTHPFSAFTASVLQLRPESRGMIRLRSAHFSDHPRITANYLATETDRMTLVKGIRIARQIARTQPLAAAITAEYAPGGDIALDDDARTLEWARNTAVTIYHPVGTCMMGQGDDAVVDARLRVRGTGGLRVADASIMPTITSGNTNAPAIMIGEKAADMLLGDMH